jgi:hypothetical protein
VCRYPDAITVVKSQADVLMEQIRRSQKEEERKGKHTRASDKGEGTGGESGFGSSEDFHGEEVEDLDAGDAAGAKQEL